MFEKDNLLELHREIDQYIKKYYLNLSLKGLFLFLSFLLASYLFFVPLAFLFELGTWVRLVFLMLFMGFNALSFSYLIALPLLRRSKLMKRMSRYEASTLIGNHFPEIADRLLNTLQLCDASEQNNVSVSLLKASIAQKTKELKVFTFSKGIDLKLNRKYAKYFLPFALTLLLLGVFIPGMLTQGTIRILNFNETFLPFTFINQVTNKSIEEGKNLPVSVKLKGDKLPDKVYLISDQGKFLMTKVRRNEFEGIIKKVKNNGSYYYEANGYKSNSYTYSVTGKSVLGNMKLAIHYPAYLNKKDEVINNIGDVTVPEGSKLTWTAVAKNTARVEVSSRGLFKSFLNNALQFTMVPRNNEKLKFELVNAFSGKHDSSFHNISVLKDAYPVIQVAEESDSIKEGTRYFNGSVSDDYGLNTLSFHYQIQRNGKTIKTERIPVTIQKGSKSSFTFAVDFRREKVQLEDKVSYHFTITDNDGINGSKATKSYIGQYELPTLNELNEVREEQQTQTKTDIEKIIQKTKQFEKDIEKLKKNISDSKSSDWNKKQQIQQLKEDQKNLEKELSDIKEQMDQSTKEKNELSEIDKEILEKQEMIEKMLEKVMDEELKKLLDEIEKLFDKQQKNDLLKDMDKLDKSAENMSKQLDRTLEMLKKLQVNEKIDDIEKELKENAEQQKDLEKKLEEEKISKEEATKKQEEINKRFEEIQKKLAETKELNKALESPLNLESTDALEESIKEQLSEAKENVKEGKKSKAKESQKEAASEMEELAEMLDNQQQDANQQQNEEDMEMLRQILESLMILSFDQESLMNKFYKVATTDPKYKRLGREQIRINNETKIVKDSLLALAKRQPKVATFIDKELNNIDFAQAAAIEAIDDHDKNDIFQNEQQTMTGYNNLALLLNESLQQMQAQSQSQMKSSGSCSKPGNGKPKPGSSMNNGDMKEMLKKQLEKMQKGMKEGGKKPGDKPGDSPGQKPGGQQGMGMLGLGSKEIAKMAAEQTAIRQRLEQLKNELNKDGNGKGNQLNTLLKELEKQEKDLINKNFNQEMINRQKDIMTRLLESEKALMERGFEEKRESKSGTDPIKSNLIELPSYHKTKLQQIELLRTVDPAYNNYYKTRAEAYFNLVD